MKIGVPKEIKVQEHRVGLTPEGVDALSKQGHQIYLESTAGEGSGFSDDAYKTAGATILDTAQQVYEIADMIIKVKEPLAAEYPLIKSSQILFTYFHFAASKELTEAMIKSNSVCIAYETVELSDGSLPLLIPMSEVAGRMAINVGAYYLGKPFGGKGKLLGGVPGVKPAEVLIEHTIYENEVRCLIKESDLKTMEAGSVIVDVAVDQGGCIETCHPTTHENPVFMVDNVLHYCVANMPGASPQTSTRGLTQATLPYALSIANKGWEKACADNPALEKGLNICAGKILNKGVLEAFNG